MKLEDKVKKAIAKSVEAYIKTLDIKDEKGIKVGTKLLNNPHVLLEFYKQPMFIKLLTVDERFYAKVLFKSKLPYKAWADYVSKNPGALREFVEDFQEMVDPRYMRKTPRGRSDTLKFIKE